MKKFPVLAVLFFLGRAGCGALKSGLPFTVKCTSVPNQYMSGVIARIAAEKAAMLQAVDSVVIKLAALGHITPKNEGVARHCVEKWAEKQRIKPKHLDNGRIEIEICFDKKALEHFHECTKIKDPFQF
jgi:hypothetical protein